MTIKCFWKTTLFHAVFRNYFTQVLPKQYFVIKTITVIILFECGEGAKYKMRRVQNTNLFKFKLISVKSYFLKYNLSFLESKFK